MLLARSEVPQCMSTRGVQLLCLLSIPHLRTKWERKEMSEGREAAAQNLLELRILRWLQVFKTGGCPLLHTQHPELWLDVRFQSKCPAQPAVSASQTERFLHPEEHRCWKASSQTRACEKDHMESVILMYFKSGHCVSKLTTTVGPEKKPGQGWQKVDSVLPNNRTHHTL